jgi:hypothetical protein
MFGAHEGKRGGIYPGIRRSDGEEMARIFVKALPRITRLLKNHTKPFIAKIAKDGSVSLLFQ